MYHVIPSLTEWLWDGWAGWAGGEERKGEGREEREEGEGTEGRRKREEREGEKRNILITINNGTQNPFSNNNIVHIKSITRVSDLYQVHHAR